MSKKAIMKKQEGNAYYKKGQFDKAKKAYMEGIEVDPTYLQCYSNLAMVLEKTNSFKQSLEVCDKILAIDPDNKKTFYRKALNYNKLSNSLETIKNAKIYLEKQMKQATPNTDGIIAIKVVIKQAKEKLSTLAQPTQRSELSYFKPSSLTELPGSIKEIGLRVAKQDYSGTLEQYRAYLGLVFQELSKSYNSEVLMQLDRIKRALYKKLVELESEGEKRAAIIDLLLSTSSSKEEKERLLRKKLEIKELSDHIAIETMKALFEIIKNSKLQERLQEMQSQMKKQYTQQCQKEQKDQEKQQKSNGSLTQQINGHNVSQKCVQVQTLPKQNSRQQKEVELISPQLPKKPEVSLELIKEKLISIQKQKSLEKFFDLFKLIGQAQIQDDEKAKCLRELSNSAICGLFAKGAVKGQKHYIKKVCKEIGDEDIYDQFNFK